MQDVLSDIIRRATSGNYRIHGNLEEAECLIAFSFGYRKESGAIVPGLSNSSLASFIQKHFSDVPKILQWEIAQSADLNNVINIINKHREKGQYLNSLEVAKQAKKIMEKNDWQYAIIIAHPYHIPRADAICTKLGIKTIIPSGLNCIEFDGKSQQEWTRNPQKWIEKEIKSIKWHYENNWI